jgi:hypothetical protein
MLSTQGVEIKMGTKGGCFLGLAMAGDTIGWTEHGRFSKSMHVTLLLRYDSTSTNLGSWASNCMPAFGALFADSDSDSNLMMM